MVGRVRVNAPDALADFLNSADEVYGSGIDGDITISSNTSLSSDMFYNNLTIASSVTLNTNGYRVFVKNLLQLGTNSVIGLPGGFSGTGSLLGGAAAGATVTNSLGGNGAAGSVTAPTAAQGGSIYYRMASQAIRGYQLTAGMSAPAYLRGGAGGGSGEGAGGGVVIVATRYISTSGACQIAATGGTNAGGGVVILVSSAPTVSSDLTLNVSGNGTGTSGTAIYIEVD